MYYDEYFLSGVTNRVPFVGYLPLFDCFCSLPEIGSQKCEFLRRESPRFVWGSPLTPPSDTGTVISVRSPGVKTSVRTFLPPLLGPLLNSPRLSPSPSLYVRRDGPLRTHDHSPTWDSTLVKVLLL